MVNWRTDIYFGISPQNSNLDILIILGRKLNFVKLRRNRFLKTIFETTLRCTLSTVGETHETILSITGGDLEPLHVTRNSLCH